MKACQETSFYSENPKVLCTAQCAQYAVAHILGVRQWKAWADEEETVYGA